MDLLPGELVGADVEAAPALRVGDEAGDRHRAFRHRGQPVPFSHVAPVARDAAAHVLARVEPVHLGQLLVRVALGRLGLHLRVFRAVLARQVAVRAEAPAIGGRDQLAALVGEVDVIDLLDRAPGERRLVLDQVLEPRPRRDRVIAPHGKMPGPVGAGPHGMHARQAADIAGDDAVRREQKAGRRDDVAPARALRVLRIAPERIVVADAVRVVADPVARGLVAPGLERVGDLDADAAPEVVEALVGDLREHRGRACRGCCRPVRGHAWAPPRRSRA